MARSLFYFILFHLLVSQAMASANWSDADLAILRSLSLLNLSPPPPSPSNRYADNKQAQHFGKKLFFDLRLSGNGQLSCASCHIPEKYFTDGLARAVGVSATGRNTPTIVGSAWQHWFYWDGRRDSLWSQALIPFEAANEMGSNRLAIVHLIARDTDYLAEYEAIFGDFPQQFLQKKLRENLPLNASPLGDNALQTNWHRLSKDTQNTINHVYVKLGKALAAYERTLSPKETKFDRYVKQVLKPDTDNAERASVLEGVSALEIAGIKLFINTEKTQCMQCHNGPLLSNGGFHNIGSGNFSGKQLDFGRMLGLPAVLLDEFNCVGQYSDAQPTDCKQLRFLNKDHHTSLKGAFKVPSLRNIGMTAPYFHDGRFNSLQEVMDFYSRPPTKNGPHELKPLGLNHKEKQQMIAFLNMFNER